MPRQVTRPHWHREPRCQGLSGPGTDMVASGTPVRRDGITAASTPGSAVQQQVGDQ